MCKTLRFSTAFMWCTYWPWCIQLYSEISNWPGVTTVAWYYLL